MKNELIEIIKDCINIRNFEKNLLKLYSEGKIKGTTHTCIGQEFIAVCISKLINNNDIVVSNHRGHGHFLSHTKQYKELFLEILGFNEGVCGGWGGSQQLYFEDKFFSNGVLGEQLL